MHFSMLVSRNWGLSQFRLVHCGFRPAYDLLYPGSLKFKASFCLLLEGCKMHSIVFRANAVVTFGITVLAALCAVASLTDSLHHSSPVVDIQVLGVDAFQRHLGGNDVVRLVLNITADLQSVFSWNTKQLFVFVAAEYTTPDREFNQISLWDAILVKKEDAKFRRRTWNKYAFVDQGNNLRGLKYNLTMYWNVMPTTGTIYTDRKVMSGFQLPRQYK